MVILNKEVRWTIPFVSSIDNIPYRIDIYDEVGGWNMQTLYPGPSPLVTDEDNTTDYFAPIRIQTGSIQVCTELPDGSMLNPRDIIPKNNISRPVRVIRTDTNVIQWQGFLSCEAYSQDYVGIPQIVDFPIISALEAMDSIPLYQGSTYGMKKVSQLVYDLLTYIKTDSADIIQFENIYYSAYSYRIFNAYIDTSLFYSQIKDGSVYVVDGESCKSVLEKICTFMGWCVREDKTDVYFQCIGEKSGWYKSLVSDFYDDFSLSELIPIRSIEMDDLIWRGKNHQYSILQGSRSVKVTSKLKNYDVECSIPRFPLGDIVPNSNKPAKCYFANNYVGDMKKPWIFTYFNNNLQAYQNVDFCFFAGSIEYYGINDVLLQQNRFAVGTYEGISDKTTVMGESYLWGYEPPIEQRTKKAGAFFIQYRETTSEEDRWGRYIEGLYCCFLPCLSGDYPIFKIQTSMIYILRNGKLKLNIKFSKFFAVNLDKTERVGGTKGQFPKTIQLVVSVGNKSSDGTYWYDERQIYSSYFSSSSTECSFEINETLQGKIQIEILAGTPMASTDRLMWMESIIESMSISYEPTLDGFETDDDENTYYKNLSTNFKNVTVIESNLASYRNNKPSNSILTNGYEMLEQLEYGNGVMERPEVDLLNRLAEYYSSARSILKLDIKKIDAIPLILLNGINDEKKYIPIAESRDWKEDVSTITCMEIPNE